MLKNLLGNKKTAYILAAIASVLVVIAVWYLFGR